MLNKKSVAALVCLIIFLPCLFSGKIDLIQIRVDQFAKDLSLNEEQKKVFYKMLEEEANNKKTDIIIDFEKDSLDLILKREKSKHNKTINKLKGVLTEDQLSSYFLIKSKGVENTLIEYLKMELALTPAQMVELNLTIPLIIAKIGTMKPPAPPAGGSGREMGQPNDNDREKMMAMMSEMRNTFSTLSNEIAFVLNKKQLKFYKEKESEINKYIHEEVLGFKKMEGKGGPPPGGGPGGPWF